MSLVGELADHRNMVGRFLAPAHMSENFERAKPVRGLRRTQEVIDPHPVVFGPAPGLIIPEGVASRPSVPLHEGVAIARPEQLAESRPRVGKGKGVVRPDRTVPAILIPRNAVVIAREHDAFLQREELPGPRRQSLHCRLRRLNWYRKRFALTGRYRRCKVLLQNLRHWCG